jgi:rod shape determining protein RodA
MFEPINSDQQPRVDKLQLFAVAGLMILGTAFVYSATMVGGTDFPAPWFHQKWFHQIIWYGLGLGAALTLCLVDYHSLARWSTVVYWLTVIALVAVLIPGIGTTHGWGARRWINLGFFQFQPSEFAKIAFLFALANFLSRPADELRLPGNFIKALLMAFVPFVLILKEPDLGSSLVFMPTALVMMLVAAWTIRVLWSGLPSGM